MSECLSIGDLERYRSRAPAGEGERPFDETHAHLASCESCRQTLAELTELDGFADRVRSVTAATPAMPVEITGYELHEEIHRGGQGIVFAATQLSTTQPVAIKVLLHGLLSTERQRLRFEREVDLAARIQHPNVVRIIDRGLTEDGHGYFVMERVDGQSLDRYLGSMDLSIEQRLALFSQICEGVRAAHQRGVLHRDLKPGNILIDAHNAVKVLDFGLAKSELDEPADELRTVAGEFMGTLAYAAPEQLRGNPDRIDARADVYALGVILYEMLTGELPHDVSGPIDSAIRAVLEHDAPRLSSGTRKIDPDLETIVLHAVEKLPDQRYPTVDAMLVDVQRHLAHLPILARPPGPVQIARKFVRRHRAGVAIASVAGVACVVIAAVLIAGIVRTNRALRIAEQRRIVAEIELAKQQSVTGFFRELLGEVDPGLSGPDMRVSELLDIAGERITESFVDFPVLRAELQSTVGETYTRLGVYEQAERQLTQAVDAFRSQSDEHPEQLANALSVLAHVQSSTQRFGEAMGSVDEAESLFEKIQPSTGATLLRAQLAHQRGIVLHDQGEFQASMEHYKRAISLIEDDDSDSARRVVAQSLIGLGVDAKRLEMFEESLAYYDRAERMLREKRPRNHPDTLAVQGNRAEILADLGRFEESAQIQRDLLERRREVFGADSERVGITMNNLADVLKQLGQSEKAAALQEQAIEIFRVNPGDPSLRLAIALHNAGALRITQGDPSAALVLLVESVEQSTGLLPDSHWIPASFRLKLAECYAMLDRSEDARAEVLIARPVLVEALGETHSRVAQADRILAGLGH